LLLVRGELVWNADDLDPDTTCNRFVKSALRVLLTSGSVATEVRRRLRAHVGWLSDVQDCSVLDAMALQPRAPRGIPEYRSALRLAQLVLESALPDQATIGRRWRSLLDEPERMGALFESFVRGFAAHELRGQASVSSRRLQWEAESVSGDGLDLLPSMLTDVFIAWKDRAPTIGECKFYQHPLIENQWNDGSKVRSEHLYQLMAYLRAAERVCKSNPAGVLIYAKAGRSVKEHWVLNGLDVRVVTVDLSRPWPEIRGELVGVVGD